ncbi:MAG: co-chaperone GroES [Thermodesulfobacteriota bacterium]|jgi:chaperonin GroES|nr:co-chaperone GroES [bacterium]MBT3849809.1 co-chaperone GroES [bacterium]MBT4435677.1 co-chaperone GroES [bacterium]MDG2445677.1 co-chaperone GroES [Thermodesulfobacteriota bacterium]NSW99866.1 co-chaperone GroES [bacterium]|tara:strand:+ start:751 stop:1041 length:291 start_codon:yes stop_codon:yes gene_type:complete
MKIKPLYDRVLVKINSPEEKTKGGIIIPESSSQEKPSEGVVAAVGTGKLLDDGSIQPLDVKEGDAVLFNKYGGMELSLGDGEYVFLTQNEILGIIE